MRRVTMKNGKVAIFCEKEDNDIRRVMGKLNDAGISVFLPYGNREGVYTINNTDKVVRISLAGILIPCGTTEEYDKRHQQLEEDKLSFFAK